MARFNAAYAELPSDPAAWQQELDERALWDHTNLDGLEDDGQQAHEAVAGARGRPAARRRKTAAKAR